MDTFDRKIILGIIIFAAITFTLYLYLDNQQNSLPPLEPYVIEGCRNLVRESAEIFVEVARDNLKPNEPDDSQRLQELQYRLAEIELEMSRLECEENSDRWAYGSFVQEMNEYEEYIADLNRSNLEN